MLCPNCGKETKKSFDIKAGQQISTDVCPSCGTSSGSVIVNPTVSVVQEPSMTADAQMTRLVGSTAHAPAPLRVGVPQQRGKLSSMYHSVKARLLPSGEARTYDKGTPQNWFDQQNIVPRHSTPPGSGLGYKTSPFINEWIKMWGVTPIADLSKYRLMYRTVPKVKRAIDKTISSAIIKGFNRLEINTMHTDFPPEYGSMEEYHTTIITYIQDWIDKQEDFFSNLNMIGKDMLIYGNAFVELVYEDLEIIERQVKGFTDYEVHKEDYNWAGRGPLDGAEAPMINQKNPDGKYLEVSPVGELVWLKPLDPLYMRVRSDSYGNIFGYLQFLAIPPVSYTTEKMAHFRYNPLSWQYETFNGTSALMSIIRTQEIIWQIENDLILLGHATVKPPMHFACGDKDNLWTEPMFTSFIAETSGRSAGGDLYTRGDVTGTPLPAPAAGIPAMVKYLEYHDQQRTIALGVPPQLLGQPEGSSRTTAEVSLDDWVNMLQNIQREISNTLEEQIFKHIVTNAFGEGAPVPRPVWNPLFDKNENDITSRIVSLAASGLISINEGRKWLADIGIYLEPKDGAEVLQDLERFKLEVEQQELTLEQQQQEEPSAEEEPSANGEVEASRNKNSPYSRDPTKWPNLEQSQFKKDISNLPHTPGGRVNGSKYKIRETLKLNDISVYAVDDTNIKLELDKSWKNSGTSLEKDYIPNGEIWLSDGLSASDWMKYFVLEQKKLDNSMEDVE